MQKWEYSFIAFKDNNFIFYETNHEPRLLFQIQKPSIFGFSDNLNTGFCQILIQAINKIAEEGWELSFTGYGALMWYFKRPIGVK